MRTQSIAAFTLAMMYALVDESWRLYIPGRYGSMTYVALDALGAVIALWVVVLYSSRQSQH